MTTARLATAALGLLVSVAISVAAWVYFDTLLVFLFVPFLPLLFRRGGRDERQVYECPTCDFRTTDESYAYCPRDGSELEARA